MTALFALLTLLADGDADHPVRFGLEEPSFSTQIVGVETDRMSFGMALSVQGRIAIPFGAVDRGDTFVSGNVIVIANRMSYLDLFDPGLGFTLEADFMARPPPPAPGGPPWERTPAMGAYVALECDWFGGGDATDDFGTRISTETLRLPQFYVGFKAQGTVQDNFYGDLRFGLGAAHFPSLDAKFRPAGGVQTTREFFQDTWSFAMELRMHFGVKAGPARFFGGIGGRLIAPPDEGVTVSMNPAELWTLDFEVGVEVGF